MNDTTPFRISPSEKYPNHKLRISTWFVNKNRIARRRKTPIRILNETEKFYVFRFTDTSEVYTVLKEKCRIVEIKTTEEISNVE